MPPIRAHGGTFRAPAVFYLLYLDGHDLRQSLKKPDGFWTKSVASVFAKHRATLAIAEKNDDRFEEAELHRLKGEVLLAQSPDQTTMAERCFRQALETAGRQQSKAWHKGGQGP